MGEICPRSDPDIAHMKYSIDPLKLIYTGLSLFQAFQAFRLLELIWAILEISANLMRKFFSWGGGKDLGVK